jgi:hypothetical protein
MAAAAEEGEKHVGATVHRWIQGAPALTLIEEGGIWLASWPVGARVGVRP